MVVAAVLSSVVARAIVLALTAVIAFALVRAAARALPRERRVRKRHLPPPPEPEILTTFRRQLELAQSSNLEAHYRLRPVLRDIVSSLVRRRRRIELDEDPEQVRSILGDAAWELLRPDREPPEDRHARGLSTEELQQLVEALERQR